MLLKLHREVEGAAMEAEAALGSALKHVTPNQARFVQQESNAALKATRKKMWEHVSARHEHDMTLDVSFKTAASLARCRQHIKDRRFVDIGACTGVVSECMAEFFNCDVVAYEPMQLALDQWMASDAVKLNPVAVTSDGRGIEMCLKSTALDKGYLCSASVAHERTPASKDVRSTASSVVFADVIKQHRPQVLKMDIETGEYENLLSIDEFNHELEYMMIEFHGIPGRGAQFLDCLKFILEQNFHPHRSFPYNMFIDSKGKVKGAALWAEIFFIKREEPLTNHIKYIDTLIRTLKEIKQ